MIIAAHLSSRKNNNTHFLAECLTRLAILHPGDKFICFCEAPLKDLNVPANLTLVVIKKRLNNILKLYYWYNVALPRQIKKQQVNLFLTDNGSLSSRLTIPQFMLVSDLSLLRPARAERDSPMLLRYFPRLIKKANTIFATEKYIQNALQKKYSNESVFHLIYHGLPDVYRPLDISEKQAVLDEITGGTDYFLFYVNSTTRTSAIITALKAFSIFKKWQKSGIRMLFLTDNVDTEDLIPGLDLYKYKEEIHIVPKKDEVQAANIFAAAFATILLADGNADASSGLYALRSGVPLITEATEVSRSLFEEAALYNAKNEKDLAENLQLIYKNELLRKELLMKGIELVKRYSLERSASLVWDAVNKKTVF